MKKYKNTVAVKSILGTGKHRTDVAEGGVSHVGGELGPFRDSEEKDEEENGKGQDQGFIGLE